jgi:4-hydroxythreonine-4-phosphate dehydrogenase
MEKRPIIVGITQGDINGIGYEVIIKALSDPAITDICVPVVYGSPKIAAYHRKVLNISNFSFNNIRSADEANHKRANMINCCDDEVRVELGKSTPEGGAAALASLEMATDDLLKGKIDVLVTAPIDKHNIQSEKFHYHGHTDYLKAKAGAGEALMFMISESMKIGFVTEHIPVKDISSTLSEALILRKLRLMNQSLLADFGVRRPHIAVLGLNPHAGDSGLLGSEEIDIIIPAINKANSEGIFAFGPYAADGFFGSGLFMKFDGVMAMYHDQGLTAFKSLAFDTGVNYTAGLPIIRTSPVHGTAFDIVGKGEASENSFRRAIYVACDIFRNRKDYAEMSKNPLQHQHIDTHADRSDELPPEIENNDPSL